MLCPAALAVHPAHPVQDVLMWLTLLVPTLWFGTWWGLIGHRWWRAYRMLGRLAREDAAWDRKDLVARVEEVYPRLEQAWLHHDLRRVAADVTPYLATKLQRLFARGMTTPYMGRTLVSVAILQVEDHADAACDRFWALLSGPRSTWIVAHHRLQFYELWRFHRTPGGWLLGEMDSSVSLRDLLECRSESNRTHG